MFYSLRVAGLFLVNYPSLWAMGLCCELGDKMTKQTHTVQGQVNGTDTKY